MFTKKESRYLATSVTLRVEIELRKLHIGSELFGVDLVDVLEPRQCGPPRVDDIQVVHSQNCEKKSQRMKTQIMTFRPLSTARSRRLHSLMLSVTMVKGFR